MNDHQKTNEANAVGNRQVGDRPAPPPPSGPALSSPPRSPWWKRKLWRLQARLYIYSGRWPRRIFAEAAGSLAWHIGQWCESPLDQAMHNFVFAHHEARGVIERAYDAGIPVQVAIEGTDDWETYKGNCPNFSNPNWKWRIKPEENNPTEERP